MFTTTVNLSLPTVVQLVSVQYLSYSCITFVTQNLSAVSVTCDLESMTVTLKEKSFPGQVFVAEHAAECSASAQGRDSVQLVIPLPQSSYAPNKCDIKVVRSIGSQNRYSQLLFTVIRGAGADRRTIPTREES